MSIQKQKPLSKRRNQTFSNKIKKRLMVLTVPHRHNQYRPYLIRSWMLIPSLLVLFGVQIIVNITSAGEVLGEKSYISTQELLSSANDMRRQNGAGDLRISHDLSVAAQAKVQDMIKNQYWSHVSPQGIQPWSWVEQSGYRYKTAGENLAKNFYSAAATTQAWYDSPTHRENLLDPDFIDVGFATAEGVLDGKTVVLTVALYGQPVFAGAVAAAAPVASLPTSEITSFNSAGTYGQLSAVDRIGVALRSVPPSIFAISIVLIGFMLIAIAAQLYARHQPVSRHRRYLHKHHGFAKSMGLGVMVISILMAYGGGQI